MTLRCISISQMDNMIEHTLNDNKGLFVNVVLVSLFVFLEICMNEKVCENMYNII